MLRLQAELEALRHVIRLIQSGTIPPENRTKQLESFLGDAAKLLQADERGGFPQGRVFAQLASTAAVVPIESRVELRTLLDGVRPTVKASVLRMADSDVGRVVLQGTLVQNFYGGVDMHSEDRIINIGAGATINAPVTVAETIQGSFNALKDAGVDPQIKAATEELLKAVAEVSKVAPEAEAQKMAKNADALAKEVASPDPDKAWYKVSLDGLQAEMARIPFANIGLVKLPSEISDDQAILLSDIFPTGYFGAKLAEVGSGDTVAVFGAGPVGQFAIASAKLLGAARVFAIDHLDDRDAVPHLDESEARVSGSGNSQGRARC